MKSKYVNGTINKDIYIHTDKDTEHRIDALEQEIVTKQDKLTAGENITISEDNVISATASIDPSMITTEVNAQSTDEQIPTAKAVYDAISGSFYDSVIYYDDNATFNDDSVAYLGEFNIPEDTQELKVTIGGTEYTLKKVIYGGYYWQNTIGDIVVYNENEYCIIYADGSANQTLPVKVEGQSLNPEFVTAVNDAITYYDVYLNNQTVTFNEQNVAELGQLNINPNTQKLILTAGSSQYEYVWDDSENAFVNGKIGSVIFYEDANNEWYLYIPNSAGNEDTISLSSADVKENFKEAVEAVGAGAIVFEIEYGIIKSNPYGAYTLLNGKTIDDVATAFRDGKPVYLMCRYGGTVIDINVQPDRGEKAAPASPAPANEPYITLWQVEYVHDASGDIKGAKTSQFTIKTNVAKVCTDTNEQTYKNIRLICNAGGDNNKFFGYEEESGSSDVIFELTSAAPKLNAEEPTAWYLTDDKTPANVYYEFNSGRTVYLTTSYNYITYKYIVTSATYTDIIENINIKAGNAHNYDIYAESFAGMDANENAQMKYLQLDDTENGDPFILYNKTIPDIEDINNDSKSFVVFDGDLTFEEYTENDETFGRLIDPEEFDEIEDVVSKDVSKCPLLWDSVEMDGVSFEKSRYRSEWYEPDTWEHGDISIEGGHRDDAYLELRAPTAGVHHIRITASYGGEIKSAIVQPNYSYFLPRDIKTALRRLNKTIIVSQNSRGDGFSVLTDYYEEYDLNDNKIYFVTVENYSYQSNNFLRYFTSGTDYPFRKIDATLKWDAEYNSLQCNITPDQFISVLNNDGIVNLSYKGDGDESGTTYFAPSMPCRINYDEEHDIYQIELLQPSVNWTGTLPYGITTNSLFDKSNEWYWEINPLNLTPNLDDPTEPNAEIPPTPDPGIGAPDI